ncbi:MAG: DUF4040 domain-containing protein [Desulfotomaculum sp.]|nr:DUF4040 domain-containing protein [Desulfotomaculum sp.]
MDIALLLLVVICAIVAIQMKDLLSAVIVLTVYSLLMAVIWFVMDAPDVALTEAAIGAGITTILFIAVLSRTRRGETEHNTKVRRFSPRAGLLIVVAFGAMLAVGTVDMPDFGDPHAPAHTHLAERFVEMGYQETASPNLVTAILICYRGVDTLGEVIVVLTAGMGVILLLRTTSRRKQLTNNDGYKPIMCSYYDRADKTTKVVKGEIIRKVVARLSIPFIQIFGLFVIAHGKVSPGGGFQGGVILATSIILFTMAFGMEASRKRLAQWKTDVLNVTGALVFLALGLVCILFGGKFLEYTVLPLGCDMWTNKIAITVAEFAIGITVAGIMITLFIETAKRDDK